VKKGIGNGGYEEALKAVIREYEFLEKLAILDGNPIKIRFDIPFSFGLR